MKAAGHRAPRTTRVTAPPPPVVGFAPGRLVAYTDGTTFRGNPAPIAWAALFVRDDRAEPDPHDPTRPFALAGAHALGNNNRAELMAIVSAIEHAPHEHLTVRTDSLLTLNCCTAAWPRRGDPGLWARFCAIIAKRERHGLATDFEHVRGHHQDPYNKDVHRLATEHAHRCAACAGRPEASPDPTR